MFSNAINRSSTTLNMTKNKTFNKDYLMKYIKLCNCKYDICYLQQPNISDEFFIYTLPVTFNDVMDELKPQFDCLLKSKNKSIINFSDLLIIFYDRNNKKYGFLNKDLGNLHCTIDKKNLSVIKRYLHQTINNGGTQEQNDICQICFDNKCNTLKQCFQCFKHLPCNDCIVTMIDVTTNIYTCPFCRHNITFNNVYVPSLNETFGIKQAIIIKNNINEFNKSIKRIEVDSNRFARDKIFTEFCSTLTKQQKIYIKRGMVLDGMSYINILNTFAKLKLTDAQKTFMERENTDIFEVFSLKSRT